MRFALYKYLLASPVVIIASCIGILIIRGIDHYCLAPLQQHAICPAIAYSISHPTVVLLVIVAWILMIFFCYLSIRSQVQDRNAVRYSREQISESWIKAIDWVDKISASVLDWLRSAGRLIN